MEHRGNFDFQSDLDFPSLGSSSADSRRSTSPQQKAKDVESKVLRENCRSVSRGRGKKQNWKAVQIEFGNHGQRYPPRGHNRPRFNNPHFVPRHDDESFVENGYRSYRSRNRRARGGIAPHHMGRPLSLESYDTTLTPLLPDVDPELSPTIMAIPYTPNYTTYVQPLTAAVPPIEPTQEDIKDAIRRQIEYYFSDENLIKDNFMRTNMTKEGFLSIKLIANFNKIRQMNVDLETITQAIESSDKLDVVDREIVRPVINPLRWPLSQPLPEFNSLVKSFTPYEPLIPSSLQSKGVIAENVQQIKCIEPDVNTENIQPVLVELPGVPQMTFADMEPASPDSVEDLSSYIESLSFQDPSYGYDCYPPETPDVGRFQQDSQDVGSYQHMLTFVSS